MRGQKLGFRRSPETSVLSWPRIRIDQVIFFSSILSPNTIDLFRHSFSLQNLIFVALFLVKHATNLLFLMRQFYENFHVVGLQRFSPFLFKFEVICIRSWPVIGFCMQFFSSKKRKLLSPGLKTGRIEKDSKRAVDGSPSSKGTLDNYLVTSPDDNSTARGSSAGKGPVKRNLTLEINLPSKDENENALLSGQLGHGTTEALGETHTENSRGLSQMGGVGVGEQLKDCSVSAHGPVNSVLK